MAISDDWDFDYPNTTLQHVDGVLTYDGGTAGQAAVGQYIRGAVTGATGKVIAVTGNAAGGTYTLTNVVGLFDDNEAIAILSEQPFDDVIAKTVDLQGIRVGDTIVDQTTGSILVHVVEYNIDGAGGGTMYGTAFAAFVNDEVLDVSGGEANVADADTTGTDNDSVIDTAVVDGTLAVPGTANENDSVIIHYDAGTQAIPEQAIVEDATTNATALVEQQYGVTGTGSLRLVDYDSSGGVFADDNVLRVQQVVNYDAQVGGQVFSVGDVVVGDFSGATGRVIAVIDDGDSTGRLILADESGTWDESTPDDIEVNGVKIAEVENATFTLDVGLINLPDGIRSEQRPSSTGGNVGQGGIYAAGDSLNIVRKLNSLYTFSQDTFDELLQMDDDEAMDAAGKGIAYSLVFGWRLEQGSDRFLRKGGLIDTTSAEVWANPQTVGAQNKITDTAFLIDVTQPFRQPQLYIEQDRAKLATWWLEGQIDALVRVKTRQDTRYIAPATAGLGQLIPGGDPGGGGFYAVFNREFYTSTYDTTEVNGSGGGVNTVALGTADDTAADRNPQGSHQFAWDAGGAFTLIAGEEFELSAPATPNVQKVGIVVAQTGDAGATGTVEYVLKSGTQFVDGDILISRVTAKAFTVNEVGGFDNSNSIVAGFSNDIRLNVIDIVATPSGGAGVTGTFIPGEGVIQASTLAFGHFVALANDVTDGIAIETPVIDVAALPSGGGGITGTFQPGERVTQAVTGATGILSYADATNDILYLRTEDGSATFSGDNDITGDESGASWDAGAGATFADPPVFSGDNDITGLTSTATWDAGAGASYPSATEFDEDLNNGDGDVPWSGSASADITGANPETIQNVYQFTKYRTRAEEAANFIEGPGTADVGTIGHLFRRLKDTYSEIKPGAPVGTFTGSMAFGQGWFQDTAFLDPADIRSFSVIDDNGVLRNPPNLQSLTITGVAVDWRVAAYRSDGPGSTVILRNEFDVLAPGGSRNAAADIIIRVGANVRSVGPLPADVPDNGVLRVLDPNDSGNYLRFPYTGVDRVLNDFPLSSGSIGDVTSGADLSEDDNVHVVFIEAQSGGASVTTTIQYVADIPIVYKARLKGFKPFRSTGTFGTGGVSLGVVQNPDVIVDLP